MRGKKNRFTRHRKSGGNSASKKAVKSRIDVLLFYKVPVVYI